MLKKLTAAGILAATATGVMLASGPANADLLSARQAAVPATTVTAATYPVECYQPGYYQPGYQPAWCANAPSIAVYPGYPAYGWNRWHHHYWPGRVYFRR